MMCQRFCRWLKFFAHGEIAGMRRQSRRRFNSPGDLLRFRPRVDALETREAAGNLLVFFGAGLLGTGLLADTSLSGDLATEETDRAAQPSRTPTTVPFAALTIGIAPYVETAPSKVDQENSAAVPTNVPTLPAGDDAAPNWFGDFADPLGSPFLANSKTSTVAAGAMAGGLQLPASSSVPQVGGSFANGSGPVGTGGGGVDGGAPASPAASGPDVGAPAIASDSGATLTAAPPAGGGFGQAGAKDDIPIGMAAVGDFVWNDLDGNGMQNIGEPGIANVLVELNENGIPIDSTTTDAAGSYEFIVEPGTYSLSFYLPEGFEFSPANQGADAVDSDVEIELAGFGQTALYTLIEGEFLDTVDAGMHGGQLATIGDFVWDDLDGNGIQDLGEPGIPAVLVELNENGIPIDSTTTDAAGLYQFTVEPGAYSLTFYKPEGFVFSPANQTDDAFDSDVEFEFANFGYTSAFSVGPGENRNTMDAGMQEAQVISVIYLPTGQGTTGDLNPNGTRNPDGTNGTPAFGGGDRFFPDAATYATRNTSRNIVRVRATIAPARAGVPVHFRSFDVDDPSADNTIDPNGANGRDNRGTVAGVNLDSPGPLAQNGYRGRLRPVGGAFSAEGDVVTVPTVINAQGNAVAEVELATSFNPGDNFRVAASTIQAQVAGLNDTTSVPTTGAINNFRGAAGDQLSIWRRVHVETDRMTTIPFGLRQTGNLTGSFVFAGTAMVSFNFQIAVADGFRGGNMRDSAGNQYPILTHTTANPSTGLVQIPLDPATGFPIANPVLGAVELTQGDFQTGQITGSFIPAGGQLDLTTNLRITQWNEYAGGIVRTNGQDYTVMSNTQGANAHIIIETADNVNPGDFTVYQDDFMTQDFGQQPPVSRITQPTTNNYYDFMQVGTVRANNRYADAYIEPEFNQLADYNSNNVTPVSHWPNINEQFASIADPYRGTAPGTPARPADYETPLFWSAYVLAGYEDMYNFDYDGTNGEFGGMETAHLAATDSRVPNGVEGEVSVVFTETIRDIAASGGTLTEAEARARSVVHEIGHQFGLCQPGPGVTGAHRDAPPNIMSSATGQVPAAQFYFHPADIVYLRTRVQPPGRPAT